MRKRVEGRTTYEKKRIVTAGEDSRASKDMVGELGAGTGIGDGD